MGAVLVKEQDDVQRLVYFFIHLLKGVESRYTTLEKATNNEAQYEALLTGLQAARHVGVTRAFTSVAYPQINGHTKVTNREIVCGLKVKLDHMGGNWVEELSSILWAYRMTLRESTRLTPFHLVYRNKAVMPVEVGVPSTRRLLYDPKNAER
ncbi:uncharacterized protein LOC122000759 [Zingiber officinale]|uniref:uncharacterized protein LOC122000759 n=1 Tax=Zingiber officinale TaxID=94328 RepID=UPI001C4ADC70|nr:uncharacterized protein LOC122000759 [Zingiber officinale]